MKKGFKIFGILILALVVVLGGAFFYIKAQEVPHVEVLNVELDNIKDGSYEGEFSEGLVKVNLSVEIKDNKIIDITIKEHQNGLGKKAEKIIDDIKSKQSLTVDVVSGATLSSNVIRRAVQEALTN